MLMFSAAGWIPPDLRILGLYPSAGVSGALATSELPGHGTRPGVLASGAPRSTEADLRCRGFGPSQP